MANDKHENEHKPAAEQKPSASRQVANPAEPLTPTKVPQRATAEQFMAPADPGTWQSGYPKLKYHPVHGGVEVKDPGEESRLYPKTDWFDSAELADAARTHTEAEMVRMHNTRTKLQQLDDAGLPVVRNSVQATEAVMEEQPAPQPL